MLLFPNCKINLGLHVVSKRPDGFHNIETVFYPVSWCDAIEVIEKKDVVKDFTMSQSGLAISGSIEQNLIYKTWELIRQKHKLPAIEVHLHKNIPMGAGLGGGSSDAAHFINLLNSQFHLGMILEQKIEIASQIGSDCAFFLHNTPVYAEAKGDVFSEIKVDLSPYYILIVYPNVHSNTKDAYSSLIAQTPKNDLREVLSKQPLSDWKSKLINDFEPAIFKKYPVVAELKNTLYSAGASYASMSGSGSAVYGIFTSEPKIELPEGYSYYLQKPLRKIL